MLKSDYPSNTQDKALRVNLDDRLYGTFAEIGAGQEVVRWFFQAGAAAGTISKSISAYDMRVSDAIYGECRRYVARERLQAMLTTEHCLNIKRLSEQRGENTAFFAFADTVSARNFQGSNKCHAWMGIKFQAHPGAADSQIIIHIRLLDSVNALQQNALGIAGVNLVYGAAFLAEHPQQLLRSLMDGLTTERLEIDMIEFSGAAFEDVDNRVMSLRLVQMGYTGAAMFAANGDVLQACEYLRKKSVVVHRGRFRPLTHVNIDLLHCAAAQFERDFPDGDHIAVMEITMHHLSADGDVDLTDFISRVDVLAATGHAVLISDFLRFEKLVPYLRNAGVRRTALALGMDSLQALFDNACYEGQDSGMLTALGNMLGDDAGLYVYPAKCQQTGKIQTVDDLKLDAATSLLFQYLRASRAVQGIENFNKDILNIHSPRVLALIAANDPQWEQMVPESAVAIIKQRRLFAG